MADVVTEGCSVAAAHRLSIPWKRKWDTKLTDVLKLLLFFFTLIVFKVTESWWKIQVGVSASTNAS